VNAAELRGEVSLHGVKRPADEIALDSEGAGRVHAGLNDDKLGLAHHQQAVAKPPGRDELHACDPDEELTFILGADTARTLASWRSPERVLRLCDFAVAVRAGSSQEDVQAAIAALDVDAARRTRFLAMGPIDVSSSQVRERAAAGLAIEQLTGAAVAGYVTEMGLYREG